MRLPTLAELHWGWCAVVDSVDMSTYKEDRQPLLVVCVFVFVQFVFCMSKVLGRHSQRPNIERTLMLLMKSHKLTSKRHSLSQICSQATHLRPWRTRAAACVTSNIRGMVVAMFLSCICFCGVFRSEFLMH